MPQQGEIRHGQTEDVVWDGSRWNPVAPDRVDKPASVGLLNYVPGLRDMLNLPANAIKGAEALPDVASGLVHNPGATLKGFVKGTSEAATPGRVGLLALLTGGATLPAALGAAGGEALAQGGRLATDAPNAAESFPEAAGNVAEAASVPAIAAGLQALPGAVERMGGTRALASRGLGTLYGGYEGYKRGGVLGAVGGAVAGGVTGDVLSGNSRTLQVLRSVLGKDGAAPAAAATGEIVNGVPVGALRAAGIGEPAIEQTLANAEAQAAAAAPKVPSAKSAWSAARAQRFPVEKQELPYRMSGTPDQNPGELFPYQKEAIAAGNTGSDVMADPRDPSVLSASMRGLKQAIEDPLIAARDAIVKRYMSASPDSVLSRFTGSR